MRIVGGKLGGRTIISPKSGEVRPSTDKTRGAIFSALGDDIIGARVADLFCGSGALGLEALSRGAEYALFIDFSKASVTAVKMNLDKMKLTGCTDVRLLDSFNIKPAYFGNISIIFADPPYKKGYGDRLIALLCLKKIAPDGIFVLEHESGWNYSGTELIELRRLTFGDSAVSFFRLPPAEIRRSDSQGGIEH